MRCKACDRPLTSASFWYTLSDGTKIPNDICSKCDALSEVEVDFSKIPDDDLIQGILENRIKIEG